MERCLRYGLGLLVLAALLPLEIQAGDPAAENRAALCRDLANMAAAAQRHFYAPVSKAGGNGAFDNSQGGVGITTILLIARVFTTSVGVYSLGTVTATYCQLNGTGTVDGNDGNPVAVTCTVFADSISWVFHN